MNDREATNPTSNFVRRKRIVNPPVELIPVLEDADLFQERIDGVARILLEMGFGTKKNGSKQNKKRKCETSNLENED